MAGSSSELFGPPDLTIYDEEILGQIHDSRLRLTDVLRTPQRWFGGVRRATIARAVQGSNSIEGYVIDDDDAMAAVDGEEPLTADEKLWAEIEGYRQALSYVLQSTQDEYFEINPSVLRTMHFMLLGHDLTKSPGRYRPGQIFVTDERTDSIVYEAPQYELVPQLVDSLTTQLSDHESLDPIVRAGLAHLNLVMIHPFRDGNGRMARALQTLVLAHSDIAHPEFSSIEEWLGRNTQNYYDALSFTGQGSWNPQNATDTWTQFVIRAHHMQAQTVERRVNESIEIYDHLADLTVQYDLPERTSEAMYDAVIGLRVRRPSYVARTQVEEKTATRDLTLLADVGLLEAVGERRGRHYRAGSPLVELRQNLRSRRQVLVDPYPQLAAQLRTTK